jgi:hypothetical protein
MANTLGGLSLAAIAQETLLTLQAQLPTLNAFTTDFSGEVATPMSSISTRVANTVTASDATSGYTASDVTSTAKTITLDNHVHVTHKFSDAEIADNGFNLLKRTFIDPAAYGVVNKMVDDLLALVTSSNFSGGSVIASSAFAANDTVDLAKELTDANAPRQERVLMLGPAYYAALAKDDAIQASYAWGSSDVIRNNDIKTVHGMEVFEYSDIPANSEDLEGFAAHKSALLIGARVPDAPSDFAGSIENVTDPDSGFTLQLREWYEPKDGARYLTATAMYGVVVGNAAALHRITSS